MGTNVTRVMFPTNLPEESHNSNEKAIHFATYKEVKFGEGIYILGNHSKLGSLDPSQAIRLSRDNNLPFWRIEILLPPNNYFYKFFVSNYDNLNPLDMKPLSDFYWSLNEKSFNYLDHYSLSLEDSFRIISFNIRYDNQGDKDNPWSNRKFLVNSIIMDYIPDFLCTQEGLPNQIQDIFNDIGCLYEYWGQPRELNGESSGIFYRKDKFLQIEGGHFWLSATPDVCSKSFGNEIIRMCSWIKLKHKNIKFFKK